MCTPILLAGAALAVGSAVANTVATNQQTSARNDVLAAERIRQNNYNAETTALNNQSRDRFVDFVPQQQQRAAQLGDILATRVTPDPNTTTGTVLPSSTSDVVNQEQAKQEAKGQAYVDQQGTALANMRSFGDLLGEISTKQARDASQVGQIGGFKQASNNVVPLELNQAQSAGDMAKFIADILQGGSRVATSAGIGAPAATGSAFTPGGWGSSALLGVT
jgi:hypothetical protein